MKRIFYSIAFLLIATTGFSQSFVEAVTLANQQIYGTARSAAMGNAIGAVGSDFTSLSVNPAGIGMYRSSEFTFTPSFSYNQGEVSLNGQKYSDNDFIFNLDQIGYVGTSKIAGSSSVVNANFGVGFNKVADFSQTAMGRFNQSSVSFLDGIVDYANSEGLSNGYLDRQIGNIEYRDWQTKLAWETYLIDPVTENGQTIDGQYQSILFEDEKVNQFKSWVNTGGVTEFVISGGLNFNHKFYLGATLGIQDVYYKSTDVYSEDFGSDSFSFKDRYLLTGNGYVFKVGAIVKPTTSIRLGLALHTPTYYNLDEESNLIMSSQLEESYKYEGTNLYSYDFRTPMKAIFSGAFIVNKAAMISFDAEYLDYSSMRYKNSGDDLSDLNLDIDKYYQNTFNLRVGGELRVSNQLSLLAGYEHYGEPFKSDASTDGNLKNELSAFSVGLGYSYKSFFLDTAFKQYQKDRTIYDEQPNLSGIPMTLTNSKLMVTLGFRF